MVSGALGWKRKVKRRQNDGTDFYRSAKTTLAIRCTKKLLEKVTWYKAKRKREDEDDEELHQRRETAPRRGLDWKPKKSMNSLLRKPRRK